MFDLGSGMSTEDTALVKQQICARAMVAGKPVLYTTGARVVFSTLTGGEAILRDKDSTWRLWSLLERAFWSLGALEG